MKKFDKLYSWCSHSGHRSLTHVTAKHRGVIAPAQPATPTAAVATTPVVIEPAPAPFSLVQYSFKFSLASDAEEADVDDTTVEDPFESVNFRGLEDTTDGNVSLTD